MSNLFCSQTDSDFGRRGNQVYLKPQVKNKNKIKKEKQKFGVSILHLRS